MPFLAGLSHVFSQACLLQGILTTLPFTLAVYMVRDFQAQGGHPPDEATVGRLTGLLAAVFCAAQLVTSYPWGIVSDRVGRKVGAAQHGVAHLG